MADKKISQLTGATTPLGGSEEVPLVQSGVTKKVSVADLTAGRAVAGASFQANGRIVYSGFALYDVPGPTGNNTGLAFSGNLWLPCDGTGTPNNGVVSIGSPSYRFKDIELAGNVVIGTAGKGIDFSADPSAAGMTSELLDDYEEGTWTPTLTFSSGSITYVSQIGTYTKIGNQVTLNFWIRVNTVSTPAGAISVASLPFNAGATGTRAATALRVNNFAITGYCVAWVSSSANTALLNDIQSGNVATIDGSKIIGNTEIGGSFTYLIA